MHNIKSFNNFTFNLIKLQNYVNKNYTPVRKDDIKLIMFNAVISSYPDQKWMSLEDSFFQNVPSEDIELTIIYTILSYKLGTFFTKCNPLIKTDLINALLIYSVNIYKIHKYAIYLLSGELLKLTEYAYNNHLIKPRHIYKIILDNFMLDKVDEKKQEEILFIIKKFIQEHEIKIFNGNYYFFNIYQCLTKLMTIDFYPEDTSAIELIPLFNTIPDEKVKAQIVKDFAHIEESDKPLIEKIQDSITIAHHYGYELPLAQEKKLSKNTLKPE